MFWTILAIVALVAFLLLVLMAMGHYLSEGGFFGWLMYWNMLDLAGKVVALIGALILEVLKGGSDS